MTGTLAQSPGGALGAVLAVATCRLAMGATYHVSPTGNDANDGSGPGDAQALCTIQAAVDRAQAGDICLLGAGVYRETVTFPRSGAPGKPITLKLADGEDVVVTMREGHRLGTTHGHRVEITHAVDPRTRA